jgi:protein-arginine kinase activator protein McsA
MDNDCYFCGKETMGVKMKTTIGDRNMDLPICGKCAYKKMYGGKKNE